MLYERDYSKLTEQEAAVYADIRQKEIHAGELDVKDLLRIPKAVFFKECLFPNNRLDLEELILKPKSLSKVKDFSDLLGSKITNERSILNFVKSQKAYFIIGSIFQQFSLGHHEAYAFPEFELPPNYKIDYLLVGKSSHGYEFILVELEGHNQYITNKDGTLGKTFRKGLKQIEDWSRWIESNYSHLKLMFEKFRGEHEQLPSEFLELDLSRIHYAVVAGRRSHFNERTYRIARKMKKENNIHILHYDNLLDGAIRLLGWGNYV